MIPDILSGTYLLLHPNPKLHEALVTVLGMMSDERALLEAFLCRYSTLRSLYSHGDRVAGQCIDPNQANVSTKPIC